MTEMSKTLEFSLKLDSVPIILTDSAGTKKEYTLREMDGEGRDNWFEFVGGRMNISAEGKVKSINNLKGLQSKLISMCLFDTNDNAVTEEEAQKFPARVLTALFEKAQELNALTDESGIDPLRKLKEDISKLLLKIEEHDFDCQAGSLADCIEWQDLLEITKVEKVKND